MDLGIVIVNWNVRDLLATCLDSVYLDLAQSGLRAVVCVVDNGSTDGSVAMLRAQFPRTVVSVAENRGMGAGNNLGLRTLGFGQPPTTVDGLPSVGEGPPPFVLILNPDTLIRPGALRQLVEFLRMHPRAGVAAPKLLNADGSLQHSGFRFPGFMQMLVDLFLPRGRFARLLDSPLNGRYPARAYASGAPFQVDHTLGAAFAVRAGAIAACGLFDESYTMFCEEIDWQWRMAKEGWERWIVPSAEVIHYGGQSTSQAPAAALLHLWTSRRRLHHRYYSPAFNAVLSRLVQLGMRQRIRENHRRSQRGELDPDRRAELNQALTEVIHIWQQRRPGREVRG